MGKLIHNRCTCKLVIKTLRAANEYVNQIEQLSLFYVLIRYCLLFGSEIILTQLFAEGEVNIVE